MGQIRLIYFEGCPKVEEAKQALGTIGVFFDEIRQNDLSSESPFKSYSSPTILDDDNIIFGSKTSEGSVSCSLNIPTVEDLADKLGISKSPLPQKTNKSALLSIISSFGSMLMVSSCPLCIPAVGAFFSAVGLGVLVQELYFFYVIIGFLLINIAGLFFSYLKHGNILPLVGGIIMCVALYVARYVYMGVVVNQVFIYGGVFGLIAISFWNLKIINKFKANTRCSQNNKCVNETFS